MGGQATFKQLFAVVRPLDRLSPLSQLSPGR